MKIREVETIAAVDVGSNSLRMIIAQVLPDGEYSILEELERLNTKRKKVFWRIQ